MPAGERCVEFAVYMIEKKSTVRETSKRFGVSKSTVHKDVTVRLKEVSPTLYGQVRALLDLNKQERHIRGGLATRKKYAALKNRAALEAEK
ncbi:MAG: sporulation transcriptional regulator SpoIIID [Oscillospiraceae bacterium]|nr:sporulation transcriptional regulator SpoIIID [Oscillospiraceae bacterium]